MLTTIEDYKKIIKKERDVFFNNSFERAYKAFCKLEYDRKKQDYFLENASNVVETMRKQCWIDFLEEEKEFTAHMLELLISDINYEGMNVEDAIKKYVNTFPEHIYQLCLSNTQSRRSRAGKEFEHIIELLLICAGIPLDSQGNIGKDSFIDKGLGKLVDTVSPGVIEFETNKRNAVLISAKTTLRERWQEVPEEMGRTGAREMFLATLDDNISENVLNTLYEANIQLTTTISNKMNNLGNNDRILSFEDLLKICIENAQKWENYHYSAEQLNQAITLLNKQIEKHEQHDVIKNKFKERFNIYANALSQLKNE